MLPRTVRAAGRFTCGTLQFLRFRDDRLLAAVLLRRIPVIRGGAIRPMLDESCPVRYRFDSLAALQRHLRLGAGFFLPDPALPGAPGARVIVEVAVPETSDRPLLHGRVRERVHDGVWLDVPSARPAARWEPDPSGPRRQHRRLACELFAEVQLQGGLPWLCRALDLSERGLRIATGFETGFRGDAVSATLLSPDGQLAPAALRGRVVWAGAGETGIEILEQSREYQALLAAAAGRWALVEEFEHARDCACAQRDVATGQRQP
jgi:PilZ domain-containing protein